MKVRPAHSQDVEKIATIIAHHASQGLMLPRSAGALLPRWTLMLSQTLRGSGRLRRPGRLHCGQRRNLRSCDDAPEGSPPGTGKAIVQALIARARKEKIAKVFALTLAPGFFAKMGFKTVAHTDLPLKVWKDCVACPKYGNCDEIAMVLELN